MNGDAGLILFFVAVLTMLVSPAERLVARRRWVQTAMIDPALRLAFPPPPPAQDLQRLAVTAEAAVESAELRRRQQRRSFRLIRRT